MRLFVTGQRIVLVYYLLYSAVRSFAICTVSILLRKERTESYAAYSSRIREIQNMKQNMSSNISEQKRAGRHESTSRKFAHVPGSGAEGADGAAAERRGAAAAAGRAGGAAGRQGARGGRARAAGGRGAAAARGAGAG